MQVKKYNISKAGRKYQDATGKEKTIWDNIGVMTEFHKDDGSISRIIEIPAISLEASLFPIEPKSSQPYQKLSSAVRVADAEGIDYPEEDIDPENIPF